MNSLSILLPYFQASATLGCAVESVREQTFQDWTLWLLNDGSEGQDAELANRFAARDSRIRSVHLPRQGLVAALREGLSRSTGALIARMDADDVCHPERLEKQMVFLERHPEVDLVSCGVTFGGNPDLQSGYAAHVDWLNTLITHEGMWCNRFVDAPVAHPTVMFRRTALERFGSYREGPFPEDFELWLRWMEQGAVFGKLPEALLTWNDPSDRLSRTDERYAQDAFYAVKCQYLVHALPPDREVWLWGAGRVTRKRFQSLDRVRRFAGFIDIDPRKVGNRISGRPVIAPQALPRDGFVLLGVANPGAREQSTTFLEQRGFRLGDDVLPVA